MTAAATPHVKGPSPARFARRAWVESRPFRPVLFLTVALVIVLGATQPNFLSEDNIKNLLTAVAVLWIVSIGMTFVLLTGGADLSVGAVAALAGIFLAKLDGAGFPGWPAVLLTVVFAAVVGGVVNGLLIGRVRLSFFVVTLASMITITGVVNLWSNTQSFFVTTPVVAQLAINEYAGLPAPIWIMAVVFLVALYVQRRTLFGRDVYAVGGNLTAASLSGIRTSRTIVLVYAISGLCVGIGAVIGVGRIGSATPQVDANLALQAIAAVLLGGTSLAGGLGGVGGTALGVLFIGVLQNGLSIAGIPSFWQQIVTGVILVVAVLGDRLGLSGRSIRRLRASMDARTGHATR